MLGLRMTQRKLMSFKKREAEYSVACIIKIRAKFWLFQLVSIMRIYPVWKLCKEFCWPVHCVQFLVMWQMLLFTNATENKVLYTKANYDSFSSKSIVNFMKLSWKIWSDFYASWHNCSFIWLSKLHSPCSL